MALVNELLPISALGFSLLYPPSKLPCKIFPLLANKNFNTTFITKSQLYSHFHHEPQLPNQLYHYIDRRNKQQMG